MQLSISNIAWTKEQDETIYKWMKEEGFTGIEIAPTRVLGENPYDQLDSGTTWMQHIRSVYHFHISSMQSIWFGRQEKLFGSSEEKKKLFDYTRKAIHFAQTLNCHNLVFGCPKNRSFSSADNPESAMEFFQQVGEYAAAHNTVFALEANPPIYQTNFINDTKSALQLVEKIDSNGFMVNFDLGTMIYNNEDINILQGKVSAINHVHISEPGLGYIQKRELHKQLAELLKAENYKGFVSVEMSKQTNIEKIRIVMQYMKEIFM